MKRIFMLLFIMLVMTGCSANVNITITPDGIQENISVTQYSDSKNTKEQIYKSYRKYMPVFANVVLSDTEPDVMQNGVKYYSRTEKDLGSGYNFNYYYKYKFNEYRNSRSVQYGFDSRTIQKSVAEKKILISTDSGGLNFFEQYGNLETVTINIKTTYKVLKNNADYVDGNVYTWVMRPNTKKGIYMELDDPNAGNSTEVTEPVTDEPTTGEKVPIKIEEEYDNEIEKIINEYPLLVGLVALLVFLLFAVIVLKISSKN